MAGNDRRQVDAALRQALAGGATVHGVPQAAGVSERTVYRCRDDPAFARDVAEARGELVARTVALLANTRAEAAATLHALGVVLNHRCRDAAEQPYTNHCDRLDRLLSRRAQSGAYASAGCGSWGDLKRNRDPSR